MKHHLTPAGPKPCHASKRPCPVGGEHYGSESEAYAAYGRLMARQELPENLRKPAQGAGGESAPAWEAYPSEPSGSSEPPSGWAQWQAGADYQGELLESVSYSQALALVDSSDITWEAAESLLAQHSLQGVTPQVLLRKFASRPDAPEGWLSEQVAGLEKLPEADAFLRSQALLESPQVGTLSGGELSRLVTRPSFSGSGKPQGNDAWLATGWRSPHFPTQWAVESLLSVRSEGTQEDSSGRPVRTVEESVDPGVMSALLQREDCPQGVLAASLSARSFLQLTAAQAGPQGQWQGEARVRREAYANVRSVLRSKRATPEVALAALRDTIKVFQEWEGLVEAAPARGEAVPSGRSTGREDSQAELLAACVASVEAARGSFTKSQLLEARSKTGEKALKRVLGLMADSFTGEATHRPVVLRPSDLLEGSTLSRALSGRGGSAPRPLPPARAPQLPQLP